MLNVPWLADQASQSKDYEGIYNDIMSSYKAKQQTQQDA